MTERIRRPRTRRKTKWQRPPEPRDHAFALPPGCSYAEFIQEIARQRHWRVEPLPEQLTRKLPSGDTMYVSARKLSEDTVYVPHEDVLNQIVAHYQDMCWAVEDDVLRIEIRDARAELLPSLPHREQRIWEVIKRELTGDQYLRELHNAGLRPRKSWVKRDCPGTYLGIIEDSKWRQAAQDEKSKIRRKAEALGLDSSKNLEPHETRTKPHETRTKPHETPIKPF